LVNVAGDHIDQKDIWDNIEQVLNEIFFIAPAVELPRSSNVAARFDGEQFVAAPACARSSLTIRRSSHSIRRLFVDPLRRPPCHSKKLSSAIC